MTRFTLLESPRRIVIHGPMGEREPTPDEAAQIRDALEVPGLPWWIDALAWGLMFAAFIYGAHGGGEW